MKKRSAEERFWEKVERRGPDECWLWQGGKVYFGYGIFCPEHGQNIGTHRFAWQLTHGTIPEGLFVCHACDQPACVNVAHLFLGTQHDNLADMRRKGRDHSKPPPPMLGEAHPQAKLTAEQVLSIRNRRNETRATLATEYGVSAGTIKSIRRGATWKHLL